MGKAGYTFLAFLSVFIWGISLAFTKILLINGFTPNIITFIRFALALFFVQIFLKSEKQSIARVDFKYFVLIALGGISLFYFFENTGLQFTTVVNTSLITATIPLFTLLTARLVLKKKLHRMNLIGILIGLSGTILLFYKDILNTSVHLKGDFLVFGSVIMWIVYSFSYKKIMEKYSHQFILKKSFQLGVLFLIPIIVVDYRGISLITFNIQTIISILFLSLFCSFAAYYLWNLAISKVGVKITSNLILLLPIISIISGILYFDEKFTLNILFASILITTGAYFSSYSSPNTEF